MSLDIPIRKYREVSRPVLRDDGSVDISGIDFSGVDMYLRCGQQYAFRYLEGKRSPPGIALAEGVGHHAAMEADNKRKIKEGKAYGHKQLTELFVDEFDKLIPVYEKECEEVKTKLDWEGEDKNGIVARAQVLHLDYEKRISTKIVPESAEESFAKEATVKEKTFRLYGQIDLTTKKKVWDYKTSRRAKSQRDADESLQLTLYGWVAEKKEVGLIVLIKDKPHVELVESTRSTGESLWGLEVAASAVEGIRRGVFNLTKPDPMAWHCSRRFCGFYGICRGKYDKD